MRHKKDVDGQTEEQCDLIGLPYMSMSALIIIILL